MKKPNEAVTNSAYKKLYDAQCAEHNKTTEHLRKVEKENGTLRGLIGTQQREYEKAVETLQDMATTINILFPKER